MKWYYQEIGGHVHVSVYLNGALCGKLCFRTDEFEQVMDMSRQDWTIEFIAGTMHQPPTLP